MKIYIYVLHDKHNISNTIYIGKTNNLQNRLRDHLKPYSLRRKNYKNNWIKDSLKSNSPIQITILEETDEDQWQEAEMFYIAYFNSIGMSLANGTDGGESGMKKGILTAANKENLRQKNLGKKATTEVRLKMSLSKIGSNNFFYGKQHTQKSKNLISSSNTGKKRTAEFKAKKSILTKAENNPNYKKNIKNDLIIQLFNENKSNSEIAVILNLPKQFVYRRIKMLKRQGELKF